MACFFIATSYGDNSVSNYFFALAREMSRRGHKVLLIVDGQRPDAEDRAGNPAVVTWPSQRPTTCRDARFADRLVKDHHPDCFIANFGSVNVSTFTGWWNRLPHRVAWYHTLSTQLALDGRQLFWKDLFHRRRKRLVYRLTTHIVANSAAAAEDIQRVYGVEAAKCSVLPYLLPDPDIPDAQRSADRVVCVGRLHRSKGQDTLIRAVPYLRTILPHVVVEFIGDGPERGAYEKLCKELGVETHCRFLGKLPLSQVLRRMAEAAVCAVPSRCEAFGLVSVEAQSVGTPVVASNVGGIREIVIDNHTGFLVPPTDHAALGERIACLLGNNQLRGCFQKAARVHFENAFGCGNIGKHVEFFEDLLERGSACAAGSRFRC